MWLCDYVAVAVWLWLWLCREQPGALLCGFLTCWRLQVRDLPASGVPSGHRAVAIVRVPQPAVGVRRQQPSVRGDCVLACRGLLRLRLRLVFMPGASPEWMAGGGGAVQTSANNGDGGFVELRALCCCSNGAYSQALGMLASPSTSRAASSPCEMADLPIVAL